MSAESSPRRRHGSHRPGSVIFAAERLRRGDGAPGRPGGPSMPSERARAAGCHPSSVTREPTLEIVDLDLADLASVASGAARRSSAGRPRRHPARECRRRGVSKAPDHGRRFRTAVRHEPPGALRSGRRICCRPSSQRRRGSHRAPRQHQPPLGPPRPRRSDDGLELLAATVAYARSKLAVMTFGFELDRRLRAAGSSVSSVVAHPGFARARPSASRVPPVVEPRWPPARRASRCCTRLARAKRSGRPAPTSTRPWAPTSSAGNTGAQTGWFQLTGAPGPRSRQEARSRPTRPLARLWHRVRASLTGVQPRRSPSPPPIRLVDPRRRLPNGPRLEPDVKCVSPSTECVQSRPIVTVSKVPPS